MNSFIFSFLSGTSAARQGDAIAAARRRDATADWQQH
jgi:hypothetical protein